MNKQFHDYQVALDKRLWERKPKPVSQMKPYLDSLPDAAHKADQVPIEITGSDRQDRED